MQATTPEELAAKRVGQYTRFLWHWVAFVTGNVALWAIDWVTGDGIEWAYWVTIPWLVVVGCHGASVSIRGPVQARIASIADSLKKSNRGSPIHSLA